jgi:NAD(P)-dependent dehydrogenase (short-subunit alcohol dehydrogenase family)
LLVRSTHDSWLIEYIADIRQKHSNELIYAEECDLSSLHSIRVFCTKWLDNSPPRRLDSVILAAAVMAPPFSVRSLTKDGVEAHWGIDYLANYHFLTLLSPALRVQPPDRDVRVLIATCPSYILGDLDLNDPEFITRGYPSRAPWKAYGAAKLALMAFAVEFQRQLDAYKRPDNAKMNAKVYCVDPGMMRSPGTRRWISFGSVLGLLIYVMTWPLWYLTLKSSKEGAESFFTGLYDPSVIDGPGGVMIRECKVSP